MLSSQCEFNVKCTTASGGHTNSDDSLHMFWILSIHIEKLHNIRLCQGDSNKQCIAYLQGIETLDETCVHE